MAKKQFKAESKRLLDLMINSIYTHKEIFLREILSNASDAMDKLAYLSLTDDKVGLRREDFRIDVRIDADARTITVSDNGIGMDKDDLENHLGVIASSGSLKFRSEVEEGADVDIIGQFGVGFYSAFMVSSEITVVTRKYGAEHAYRWHSAGADGYTVSECEKESVGTDVIMTIKVDEGEETYSEYLDARRVADLIRKYSDYIRYPIRMTLPQSRRKEGSPDDKPEFETVYEEQTVNSMVPLWQRKRSEVTDEEYEKFYMEKFHDWQKPRRILTVSVEGAVTYKALVYVPSQRPYNYYAEEYKSGLQLYSAGVLIMEDCSDLLPDYLRFVRGVVDSPDLSLNISREILQHDRQLKVIATSLEKKIRGDLEKLMREERESYEAFFNSFGRSLKYGVLGAARGGVNDKDALCELLLYYSSTEKRLVSLREYVDRMSEEQKYIYYAPGTSVAQIDRLPQTELLKEKNWEILYLTEDIDEFAVQMIGSYAEKPLRSVVDGDLELGGEEEKKEASGEKKNVLDFVKETLGDRVREVRISKRLKTHPVCMTAGEGMSFEMEKYMRAVQPEVPFAVGRILELNADHPAFAALEAAMESDREKAATYAKILFDQAALIAGLEIEDPGAYTDLVCSLMK